MNIRDFVVLGIVTVAFCVAVLWARRRKKQGKGCCGDCGKCGGCQETRK